MRLLQALVRKVAPWQWTRGHQIAFDLCKEALLTHAQLHAPQPGVPFELKVTTVADVASWGLWQRVGAQQKEPIGFWSRMLKGAEPGYTPLEKQTLVVVWALQDTEPMMGPTPVIVRTPIPLGLWVRAEAQTQTGVAQAATHFKWKHLQQRMLTGRPSLSTSHALL